MPTIRFVLEGNAGACRGPLGRLWQRVPSKGERITLGETATVFEVVRVDWEAEGDEQIVLVEVKAIE